MFLIFDTETTGLPDFKKPADAPGQPRLASIAAALINEAGEVEQSIYHLVRPDGWSPEVVAKSAAAFSVNGLTLEQLQNEGGEIADVLASYDALVDQCTGIAAYGVAFDQKILRAEQRLAGRPDRFGERPTFCVLQAVRSLIGAKKPVTLTEAYQQVFGEPLPGAHHAQVDLKATVRLFLHLQERNLVTFKPQGKA